MNSRFYLESFFCTGAWVSARRLLRSKNPVHSVFYLVLVFANASALLCLQGLDFFALLQLMVYVGALAVLFRFVVMLLDIPATERVAHQRGTYPVVGVLVFTIVFVVRTLLFSMSSSDSHINLWGPRPSPTSFDTIICLQSWSAVQERNSVLNTLGTLLYGVHVDLLILASVLLLVAMVGAVVLTLKRRAQAPVHDTFIKHSVDFTQVVVYTSEKNKK
uniref:NADH-ubiquinone oxidoreductase chain 6 n=1 Tax=Chromochloris zofingiensis TaxID=31302 RepID=A0A076VF23_9CHLO|nr:NADH dehydrogenase subunit 6 [Chromochloris zofingiensis]AIK29133.1 NADH dehydrogenase subunit 6 [Chromochloris zofingiensis]